MARINYQHARREKERVRKARQQEKLQRRTGHDSKSAANLPRTDAPATMPEPRQPAMPEPRQPATPLQPESGK